MEQCLHLKSESEFRDRAGEKLGGSPVKAGQRLKKKFWFFSVNSSIRAGRGDVGAESTIANFIALGNPDPVGQEFHSDPAPTFLINRDSVFQTDNRLNLAVVNVVRIVMTNPQRHQVKLYFPVRKLLDVEEVAKLRPTQCVATRYISRRLSVRSLRCLTADD